MQKQKPARKAPSSAEEPVSLHLKRLQATIFGAQGTRACTQQSLPWV